MDQRASQTTCGRSSDMRSAMLSRSMFLLLSDKPELWRCCTKYFMVPIPLVHSDDTRFSKILAQSPEHVAVKRNPARKSGYVRLCFLNTQKEQTYPSPFSARVACAWRSSSHRYCRCRRWASSQIASDTCLSFDIFLKIYFWTLIKSDIIRTVLEQVCQETCAMTEVKTSERL